jgi:acyl carrier protein
MTIKNIEIKLIKGIASITSRDESSIKSEVPFHELGIDSLGFVEILVFIEKTFDLRLIETDLTKKDFETINSLASFIGKKL